MYNINYLIQYIQQKFLKTNLQPGMNGGGTGLISIILVLLFLIWLSSGLYRVSEKEQAVILRFGAVTKTIKDSGLNYHLPTPIEEHLTQSVSEKRSFNVGTQQKSIINFSNNRREEQVFMLTSDENIVDVNVTVHWFIKDLGQYLFSVLAPEMTVRVAAESAVREVIAQTPMEAALTKGKQEITTRIHQVLQKISNEYEIGIQIDKVNLERVEAPPTVIDAFRDVQSARADKEHKINEARGYRDSIIPVARGEAERVVQQAKAYCESIEVQSLGEVQRFISILQQYQIAPNITRKRMYLEAIEEVLKETKKILISGKSQSVQGILPYLPLPNVNFSQSTKAKNKK